MAETSRMRISVTIDPSLLSRVDRYWRVTFRDSRSAMVEEALERLMASENGNSETGT